MHKPLIDWLDRCGISMCEGIRILKENGVPASEIYGSRDGPCFSQAAALIQEHLATKSDIELRYWPHPDGPRAPAAAGALRSEVFPNVWKALDRVGELSAKNKGFYRPEISTSPDAVNRTGMLWETNGLMNRKNIAALGTRH